MGIRETQPMGLPKGALEFLEKNAKIKSYCKYCHRNDGYIKKPIKHYGMFDELSLYEYDLKDGTKAQEFIQRENWSSGPMIWLGLKTKDKIFKWNEKNLEED